MRQLINYVRVDDCLKAIDAAAARVHEGLIFAAVTPQQAKDAVLAIHQPADGIIDLSRVCQVLGELKTAKMMGQANRGIEQAIAQIKAAKFRRAKIVPVDDESPSAGNYWDR
jgi:hypothetical protein